MAISPATYNVLLQRRADYYVTLQFKDSDDNPIDLTGWTVESEVWNKDRNRKYADFVVEYSDRTTGTIKLSLTDEATSTLPDKAYYDVLLTDQTGIKEYYLEGSITVSEGYTS